MPASQPPNAPSGPLSQLRRRVERGVRTAWYGGQYLLTQRMFGDGTRTGEAPAPYRAAQPTRAAVRGALRTLNARDEADVRDGLLPPLAPITPGSVVSAIAAARTYLRDVPKVAKRREARAGTEVKDKAPSHLPTYYRQNFHYQTDGWMSEDSARLYDVQTDVLFTGTTDLMRRAGLAEVRRLGGGDSGHWVDLGCGNGRFDQSVLAAASGDLRLTGVDLSAAYLTHAEKALPSERLGQVTFLEANAESVPLDDQAADVVSAVYLFHELPPRVRETVACEIVRLLKPGGLFLLVDSLQTGDYPDFDRYLEAFPRIFHEPYYSSWCALDSDALFAKAGLEPVTTRLAYLSKAKVYRKL